MTKTLNVNSVPSGIEMNVRYSSGGQNFAQWVVTNKALTLPDDASDVEVLAPNTVGEPVGTTARGWYFVEWEDHSVDRLRSVTLNATTTVEATYNQQIYFPTRHHARRSDKFEGKVDEEVYGLRTTALKSMMVEQQESTTAQQMRLEELVGNYVHAQGLYGMELHHYRNFSQELYGLTRLFKGETLNKEASLKAQKWYGRGLEKPHLEAIAKLFGITITWV